MEKFLNMFEEMQHDANNNSNAARKDIKGVDNSSAIIYYLDALVIAEEYQRLLDRIVESYDAKFDSNDLVQENVEEWLSEWLSVHQEDALYSLDDNGGSPMQRMEKHYKNMALIRFIKSLQDLTRVLTKGF